MTEIKKNEYGIYLRINYDFLDGSDIYNQTAVDAEKYAFTTIRTHHFQSVADLFDLILHSIVYTKQ